MTNKKIEISDEKFDINMLFYFFLKHLVKTKLTERQTIKVIDIINNPTIDTWEGKKESISEYADTFRGGKKYNFINTIDRITIGIDFELFDFSLRLYSIKDLLLEESKLKRVAISDRLSKLPPLSLEYDKISLMTPYATRVNGALLALIFFDNLDDKKTNFMSSLAEEYLVALSEKAIYLKGLGVEPNQIFMLVFNESINQSIISDSGLNYEERIEGVLVHKVGVKKEDIKKTHDKDDASTEFDFLFDIKGRTYGVGAKKTLRERYKQFIKTGLTSDIDIMIEITIGLDLNKAKAETIRKHGTYIFLSDEIYDESEYLIDMEGVYPTSKLTRETLLSLE